MMSHDNISNDKSVKQYLNAIIKTQTYQYNKKRFQKKKQKSNYGGDA